MAKLEDIKVGKRSRRSHFNLVHDGETTSGFGFCQPTIARLVPENSLIKLQTKSTTRLAPLPCPTFGRIQVKTRTTFVPMKEVFEAFEYFQSQKTVASALRKYVPTSVDYVTNSNLYATFFNMFLSKDYWIDPDGLVDINRLPFRVSVYAQREMFAASGTHGGFSYVSPFNSGAEARETVSVLNDELSNEKYPVVMQNMINFMYTLLDNAYLREYLTDHFDTGPSGSYFSARDGKLYGSVDTTLVQCMSYIPNRRRFVTDRQASGIDYIGTDDWSAYGDIMDCIALYNTPTVALETKSNALYRTVFHPMSMDNADFFFKLPISGLQYQCFGKNTDGNYTAYDKTFGEDDFVYIGIHLTPIGKRMVGKILNPLGLFMDGTDKRIEIPRLFALYKSYFDKYNPGREKQWRDTSCYRLIHSYYDTGVPLNDCFVADNTDLMVLRRKLWYDFWLDELAQMYFSLPVDNITVAMETPVIDTDSTNSISTDLWLDNSHVVDAHNDADNSYGTINDVSNAGGLGVKWLQKVLPLLNKNSIIGSKVDAYLRAHNIGTGLPHTNTLGEDEYMCFIDEIYSTTNNDESLLGEYAGKCLAGKQGDKMRFETTDWGYLLQTVTIVPFGGYVQGSDVQHIDRYDFPQIEFDSLGHEPLLKDNVVGRQYNMDALQRESIFGFVPRYFRDKVITNTSGGDFSLRGSQAQFLPYSLNRLFYVSDFLPKYFGVIDQESPETLQLSPDEELRYIGKYEQFGNYNRIFYDVTGVTDNFIMNFVHDLHIFSPLLPVSESFDTFDEEIDDSVTKVEHS